MVQHFHDMAAKLNISYDRFIRTTDTDHVASCQALWRAMVANGDIYLDRYEGWYSVRDEAYYDDSELVEGQGASGDIVRLSPQGTEVEWTVEESWFFRLSAYQERLLAHFDAHPEFIQPSSRFNEMRAFVAGGLRDLSISRTSFDWGIQGARQPRKVMSCMSGSMR
jgi:methionyl-tRNA synthetase